MSELNNYQAAHHVTYVTLRPTYVMSKQTEKNEMKIKKVDIKALTILFSTIVSLVHKWKFPLEIILILCYRILQDTSSVLL